MDEGTIFFETDSSGYLGSLIICRQHLKDSEELLSMLDKVITLELELALRGAEKAKSEALKAAAKDKDNLRPIK